ncbi:nuclear transport factor 2 family protein [Rheinheimera mesophila]|uniref:Nuclear transport factor 2 family protein n=1 Tax=Rheinheimera mesophila TaxID=1547515 RepID=A0A3P3QH34_9GAMM|nr:nuclear transport factor 2 family protein [Rheinheimera mesophila]RRJ20355.1 nuclear transport factor 2 family protein [Rheinheimera mesophila]
MTVLETAIDRYFFATNARNNTLAAECFDPDASIFDEGKQLTGLESIRHWLQQTQQKYQPVVQVLAAERAYGEVWVKANVSGRFQGSPIQLNYVFALQDGKISRLMIR